MGSVRGYPAVGGLRPLIALLLGLAAAGAWIGCHHFRPLEECRVVGVSDGDTIRVLCDGREVTIRLWGIDCPERGMDFGRRARQWTADHAFGKSVQVLPMDRDAYGRLVARVYVDGRDLSLGLVEAGLAWHFVRHAPNALELAAAEAEARSARKGLWSHPNPIPPWEFREDRRRERKPRRP
jgi:micrococcal nuclease